MVGWIATVESKSALVSPAFTAIAAACIISGASGAIMWMPTRRPLSRERIHSVSFLLRVVLPDKPGNLGAVASALGGAGADILSVDVVERGDGQAVDDIAVELPTNRPPDVLITAAESVPGVSVESVRPHTGQLDTHREKHYIKLINYGKSIAQNRIIAVTSTDFCILREIIAIKRTDKLWKNYCGK